MRTSLLTTVTSLLSLARLGLALCLSAAAAQAAVPLLPAEWARPVTSAREPGFTARFVQAPASPGLPNDNNRTEQQLAGVYPIAYQTIVFPTVINYGLDAGGHNGNFGSETAIPRAVGNDNLAAEVVAYLALNRGSYRFGVNSDDGFRLTAGPSPEEAALVLGEFSGGRGATDSLFDFEVAADGLYAFRLTWEQGVGGANFEWFSVDASSGQKTLINDGTQGAVGAFRYVDGLQAPIAIPQQPQNASSLEYRSATFTIGVSGGEGFHPLSVSYQWQSNRVDIPGAFLPAHETGLLGRSSDQAGFRCVVTRPGYPALISNEAKLTVIPDAAAPQVVGTSALARTGRVGIRFDELLDPNSAANPANYEPSYGAAVSSAQLLPDGRSVELTFASFAPEAFTVRVSNLKDLAGNPVPGNMPVAVAFGAMQSQDVGTPGVDPVDRGRTQTSLPTEYDVVAGGSDIWNINDGFHFVYGTREGDFDIHVRVARLDAKGTWSRAGLMAREDLSSGSRNVFVTVFPSAGANAYQAMYRGEVNQGTAGWPGNSSSAGVPFPNAWIRLKRQGNEFTAFRSDDGTSWTQFALINIPLQSQLLVGMATSAQNNGAGQATTAWYRDFGGVQTGEWLPITRGDMTVKIAAQPDSTYSGNQLFESVPGDGQSKQLTIVPYSDGEFVARVSNMDPGPRTFTLRASESGDQGWETRYLSGGTDVTRQMRTSGFRVDLPSGGMAQVKVAIRPGILPISGGTKSVVVQAFDEAFSTNPADSVKLIAEAGTLIRPDLGIAVGQEDYTGFGVFNTSSADQFKVQDVAPGSPATFLLQLRNRGNVAADFNLTASTPGTGWTARYYQARQALRLDGANAYVDLGNWTPGSRWTVEAWVNASSAAGGRRTIAGGLANCADWGLTMQDGQFAVVIRPPGGCTSSIRSGVPVEPNHWFHLAATCDGTTGRLFIDGQLAASAPVDPNYEATPGGVRIGGEVCCGGNNFPGLVRHVRIWNRALETAEVVEAAQQRLSDTLPGLLGHWPLDQARGSEARDVSSHNRHGNLLGGAIWETQPISTLAGREDVTDLMRTGLNVSLGRFDRADFLVELTPASAIADGSVQEIEIAARASIGDPPLDVVKAVVYAVRPGSSGRSAQYQSAIEFRKGRLVGVESASAAGGLRLSPNAVTYPYIWVPNSNEGTISKVDTRTGKELGRYRTSPRSNANPSRTTVDLWGNCYVGNRQTATLVKVGLLENGQYVDRNGDGLIQTSRDLDDDGNITGAELLAWGQDECVLFEVSLVLDQEGTFVPGDPAVPYADNYWNPGTRGIAVDAQNNVWVGTYETRRFYYVDGSSGAILKKIDVSSVNHTSYGAVMDANGVLWSSGNDKLHVLRLDTKTDTFRTVDIGHTVYGLGLDRNNHLFVSGWQASKLTRVEVTSGTKEWTLPGLWESRGIAVTADGDVWVANSGLGTVARWSNDGVLKGQIAVGNTPTGVSVDSAGYIWVVNNGDENISRIDPETGAVDLVKRIIGATHYGYSDMTGIIARNTTTRLGFWTAIHDSGTRDTPWGTITWVGTAPSGTSISVRARTSPDQITWSVWEPSANGASLSVTPPGRFIQLEVTLQSQTPSLSPTVTQLTVTPADSFQPGDSAYSTAFEQPTGPEWSVAKTEQTPLPRPAGGRNFLGRFGNSNVALTLSNLPPHLAVTVSFDLFVIGSWDGNDSQDGPDIWELNMGGGLKLLRATFHNAPLSGLTGAPLPLPEGNRSLAFLSAPPASQSYPDNYPSGNYPPRSDSAEDNSLGFVTTHGIQDSVYHVVRTVPHTASTLVLNFNASGLSPDLADESWGLENVKVHLTSPAQPVYITRVSKTPAGPCDLRLSCQSQKTYVLQASSDLKTWSAIGTNTATAAQIDLSDPEAGRYPLRFYRTWTRP